MDAVARDNNGRSAEEADELLTFIRAREEAMTKHSLSSWQRFCDHNTQKVRLLAWLHFLTLQCQELDQRINVLEERVVAGKDSCRDQFLRKQVLAAKLRELKVKYTDLALEYAKSENNKDTDSTPFRYPELILLFISCLALLKLVVGH